MPKKGESMPESQRRKIARALKGKEKSDEHKKKISESVKETLRQKKEEE